MIQLFLSTALLGLPFSATPGAVNAESFRRGMASGFWSTVLVLVGDMVWAELALWGVEPLLDLHGQTHNHCV